MEYSQFAMSLLFKSNIEFFLFVFILFVLGKQVDLLVSKIRNQTEDIERQLRIQADRQIREIQNVFQVPVDNQTLFKQVDEHFKKLVGMLNRSAVCFNF